MFENDLISKDHDAQASALLVLYRRIENLQKETAALRSRVDELEAVNDRRETYEMEQSERQ